MIIEYARRTLGNSGLTRGGKVIGDKMTRGLGGKG